MKVFLRFFLFVLLFYSASCATQMITKSPQEVKQMTTRSFEINKDLVLKSCVSLLQSEGFLIEEINDKVGLIKGTKRLENKNAKVQRFLIGTSVNASIAKISVYIEEFNENLCEVKLTIYEGKEESTVSGWGQVNTTVNDKMVYEPETYNTWFNNLRAEIARREALIN